MEKETKFRWIGPFPVGQFMKEFLPKNEEDIPEIPKNDYFNKIPKNGKEEDMYNPLVGWPFL